MFVRPLLYFSLSSLLGCGRIAHAPPLSPAADPTLPEAEVAPPAEIPDVLHGEIYPSEDASEPEEDDHAHHHAAEPEPEPEPVPVPVPVPVPGGAP
jgi:hypothetical protein